MKKITLLVFLSVMTLNISAQTFLGTISNTGPVLQFKIRPTGGDMTTALGYFEFSIRYSSSTNIIFSNLTANTANTNPATGFPGLSLAESVERSFGGYKYKRFVAHITIPSQTYRNGTEYKVFEINLSSSTKPLDIQLVTDYESTNPTDFYFVVSDGAGNPLVDVTGVNNFYPTQALDGTTRYFSLLNIVLPIELLRFQGEQTKEGNLLSWQTTSEVNSSHFDIEYSTNGTAFQKTGTVKAQGKAADYQYIDKSRNTSTYYRLKINALDNGFLFSKSIFLEQKSEKKIKIRSNTEGSVWIETDNLIEYINVVNAIGQVVETTKDKQFSIADLPKGIYVVVVKTSKGFVSEKVLSPMK